MKVFKFGGASVKDPKGVRNVVAVLKHEGYEETLVVISAMGKMTNAFEEVVQLYLDKDPLITHKIEEIKRFHFEIIQVLFEDSEHFIFSEVNLLFQQLEAILEENKLSDYNFIYDQVVCFGELLSTKIVSAYLTICGIENSWLDVRQYLKTDTNYRDARVQWGKTEAKVKELHKDKLYITQGFLGGDDQNNTTTLGREGSDFTAAIFAFLFNASQVTIWKDVPGVLNADPRYFEASELLQKIPYSEAIEMAFYGASVIHPKTLKPLENKKIPLYVRSFYELQTSGTQVGEAEKLTPELPCFILKKDQKLVAISALDFSFMVEHNLSDIFNMLHRFKLKVNLIQNSAISFSVCIEDNYNKFKDFLEEVAKNYSISVYENVRLFTIRHATDEAISTIEKEGKVLLKQVSMGTVQLVIADD